MSRLTPAELRPLAAITRAIGPRGAPAEQPAPASDAESAYELPLLTTRFAGSPRASSSAASPGAQAVSLVLLAVGLAVALLVHGKHSTFQPKQGFVLFTGFYVAAQAVERILELVLPPGEAGPLAKADRGMIVGALAFVLGIALSLVLGLRFLSAVQVAAPPRWLDVFVTGLVIGGGTKPLHDLITTIQKSGSG